MFAAVAFVDFLGHLVIGGVGSGSAWALNRCPVRVLPALYPGLFPWQEFLKAYSALALTPTEEEGVHTLCTAGPCCGLVQLSLGAALDPDTLPAATHAPTHWA